MIEQIEDKARQQLAHANAAKASVKLNAVHKSNIIELHARCLSSGRIVFGYSFDGIRLERSTLLQLLCTDSGCPDCQRTQANWKSFRGIASPVRRTVQPSYTFKHLMEEVPIQAAGRSCVARPAIFQCRSSCPVRVHTPAIVSKTGWDLFENNRYIAGGLIADPSTQEQGPALPTIDAVMEWLTYSSTSIGVVN